MSKIKCPYTYPHKSRKAMVDYLAGIGGYSRFHDGSWPIEFNVASYNADFEFDHIWKTYAKEYIPAECNDSPELLSAYHALARKLHKKHEEHMWSWGQEDAARMLDAKECDCYQMLWDGTPVKATLELHGRGGKHLVITEFNGSDLSNCNPDNLHDALQPGEDGWGWSFDEVKLFYKYVRQCEQDFTVESASKEVEYQGVACFFLNVVASEWEDAKKEMADHEAAVDAAKVLFQMEMSTEQLAAFRTLCDAAHVSEDEAEGR